MLISEFIKECQNLKINLTDIQLQQLEKYYELLIEWNKVMNLTGITEKDQVYLKHFYDSLTLVKVVDLNKIDNLCDVGTGAGFPGLVLKIVFPNLNVTLVDSLNKRIKFLEEVIKELKLDKIECIHARAEEFALNNRNTYDVVTARAVAPLNILIEYCAPLVKNNKYFIPMKASLSEEITNSENAINKLNLKIDTKKEFYLPIENSKRTLIKFIKIKDNPLFPRSFKDIKNKPL